MSFIQDYYGKGERGGWGVPSPAEVPKKKEEKSPPFSWCIEINNISFLVPDIYISSHLFYTLFNKACVDTSVFALVCNTQDVYL